MDSRRLAYLRALEIDVWRRRAPSAPDAARVRDAQAGEGAAAMPESASRPAIGPRALREEGIDRAGPGRPEAQGAAIDAQGEASTMPALTAAAAVQDEAARMGWDELAAAVAACTRCNLHATRTQAVFGVGSRSARWMVIGEAPGADEDRQGEPFVGRAGQLLNAMLQAIGLAREQVYITNILKCRPPHNRDPRPEEVRACIPYLFRQIELIDPVLILCVGRIAAQTLLQTDAPIGKLRGRLHRIAGHRPMIVTYHPAYLLRSPGEKRKAWADLVLAMRTFEQSQGVPA